VPTVISIVISALIAMRVTCRCRIVFGIGVHRSPRRPSQNWFAFLFVPTASCHKKGVAHHDEQSVRHANSSLRDAYIFDALLHVGLGLGWTWVGHRDGLTCLFARLVGSSGLEWVSLGMGLEL
jgi:hypothetical protein